MNRSSPTLPAGASSLPVVALIHAGFILTGMVTTLLGPILPALSAKWSLDDAHAGYLFTSQFLGSMAGAALSGTLIPRRGFQFSLVLGFGLMSAGVAALGLGAWATGLLSVLCYGIGLGAVIATTNLWVAEVNPGRRAAALNILNLAWGIGAVAYPSFTVLFRRSNSTWALLFGLAALLGLMSVCLAWGSFANLDNGLRQADPPVPARRSRSIWGDRFISILGVLFFLYVGTENALGGWVASYAQRVSASPGAVELLAPSFFWGALLVGRALAPACLRHVGEAKLVRLGLLLAAIGVAILLASATLAGVFAGISLAGLGLASVFPITVALLSQGLGAFASRVGGLMFALGGLGGATLPWLVGFLSTHFGSLKAGLVVPLLGCLTMIAMHSCNLRPVTSDPPQPA